MICVSILLFLGLSFFTGSGFILDTVQHAVHSNICYDGYGCFSTKPPFWSLQRPLTLLPDSPEKIQTDFLLYTRRNPSQATEQHLRINDTSGLNQTYYDGSKRTKILVHGFTHNGHRQWLKNMAAALLKKEDMNIIVVDWGHGSGAPYTQATANTRLVGAQIAVLVKFLIAHTGPSADDFHIIGHSLGAHIAGYAGKRLTGLGRISGLDPADPYFTGTDPRVRLAPTDAAFVDVLHTDGTSILELGFGTSEAMGHVDFFPNGGKDQPGCDTGLLGKLSHTAWSAVSKLDLYAAEGTIACSHERSYEMYTESISTTCPFTAYPCTSADEFHKGNCLRCYKSGCSQMGYNADKFSARGSLFLETQSAPTYCNYHYQFNISGTNEFDGQLSIQVQGSDGTTELLHLMRSDLTGEGFVRLGKPSPAIWSYNTSNETGNVRKEKYVHVKPVDVEAHRANTVISKMFRTRHNIGTISAIGVAYEKTHNVLVGWAYPENWTLAGITVWDGHAQKRSTFCGYGKSITNHAASTFGLVGTC